MAISSLVLLFYILRGKSKFIKVLAICAFLGAATYVYNSEIGQSIVERTIKQRDDSAYKEEDVRIWDLKYFLDKGQEDVLTYLFGNGVYSAKDSRLGPFWVSTIVILLMLVWRDIYSILVSSLLPHFFMFAIIQ